MNPRLGNFGNISIDRAAERGSVASLERRNSFRLFSCAELNRDSKRFS